MWNWISKLEELRRQGQKAVIVTVTQNTGSTPREPGAKMIVLNDGSFFGTVGGGHFEELAIQEATRCFQEGQSKVVRYPLGAKTGQCCGGVTELFFEIINGGPSLYVFGTGHVGQALLRTLTGTPFVVHALDEREEWILSEKIPPDIVRHHVPWSDFVDVIPWSLEKTYVVIMTHRHDMDQEIIEKIIRKPLRFLGLIGSESKWSRFKQRMTNKGYDEHTLSKVRCPVGLKIGGKAPQEIAISIAAELLEDHYGNVNGKVPTHHTLRRTGLKDESAERPTEI